MYLLPTLQATPRGLWGVSGRSEFTTVEHWLGAAPTKKPRIEDLVVRYLKTFGPATPGDAQNWSGIPAMRAVFEKLRPRLRTFHDERGRELFDVPRAPLPDPDTPAPVRFLPEYDNVVLGHADRSRIVTPEVKLWTELGWGTILVDGFAAARWKLEKGASKLTLEPFRRLTRAARREVDEEGGRLMEFVGPHR